MWVEEAAMEGEVKDIFQVLEVGEGCEKMMCCFCVR